MNNFGTIYKYELKKIVCKKLFIILAILMFALTVFTPFSNLIGNYIEDGTPIESNLSYYKETQAGIKAISGRKIDIDLMRETMEAYKKVPTVPDYTKTDEYKKYARPYNEVFAILRGPMEMKFEEFQKWEPDEEEYYKKRTESIEQLWSEIGLTDGEKQFFRDKDKEIEKPLTYYYHDAYDILLSDYQTIGIMVLVMIAIVLSGLFPGERAMKTDQLILSNKLGKKTTFLAKMSAGITVGLGTSVILTLSLFAVVLGYFGTEGYDLMMTVFFRDYTYPVTVGTGCIICYAILQVVALLWSIFVMAISEFIKNGMATLATTMLIVIVGGMISVPDQFRVIGQIWDWLPTSYLAFWNVFDERTLPMFGKYFLSWQVLPVLYLFATVIIFFVGKRKYESVSTE